MNHTQTLKLSRKGFTGTYWNFADHGNGEYICGRGLRVVCAVPDSVGIIYACVHNDKPKHDHWFLLHPETGIDWRDDECLQELDLDFEEWLINTYTFGHSYLVIQYEEK